MWGCAWRATADFESAYKSSSLFTPSMPVLHEWSCAFLVRKSVRVRLPSPAPHACEAHSEVRIHGKDEVVGSNPIAGSIPRWPIGKATSC